MSQCFPESSVLPMQCPMRIGDMAFRVTDSEGVLVGLLTRQNLAEMMIIKTMRPDWRFHRG